MDLRAQYSFSHYAMPMTWLGGVIMIAISAAILLLMVTEPAEAAPALTPKTVRLLITAQGPKAAVDHLSEGAWNRVENYISAGLSAWIALVPMLSDGADAGDAEGLSQSLIYALPKVPSAVLAVIDLSGRSVPREVDAVCSASFDEGDATDVPRYRARAIAAVAHVGGPRLAEARKACLAQLRASGR